MISHANINEYTKDCIWLKNKGRPPLLVGSKHLLVRFRENSISFGMYPKDYIWSTDIAFPITEYAIVDDIGNK